MGAVSFVACETNGASEAVGPLANLRIVLPVQAASSAVSGFPSDHLPGLTVNVQVRPSLDVFQDVAQSPTILKFVSY